MHLERQTLLKVHIFIGIYFEEEADGLMKERRGAKPVIAIVAVVIVALVVLMKKRKAEN